MNKKVLIKSLKDGALATLGLCIFLGMLMATVASAIFYGPILAVPVGVISVFIVLTWINYEVSMTFGNNQ